MKIHSYRRKHGTERAVNPRYDEGLWIGSWVCYKRHFFKKRGKFALERASVKTIKQLEQSDILNKPTAL